MSRSAPSKPARPLRRRAGPSPSPAIRGAQPAHDEATPSADLGRLATLQAEWMWEESARAAQAGAGWWSALFDAQAAGWRHLEQCAQAGLQPWLAGASGPLAIEAQIKALDDDPSPQAWLQRSAAAWLVLGKVCLNALEHDLQPTPR